MSGRAKHKRDGSRTPKKIYAVDLFCGAGGLTHGLERAGIKVKLGVDIDPACKFPYEYNNRAKFLLKRIEDVTAEEILSAFPCGGFRLLAGCAPCQTFSTYYQKASESDDRWRLLTQVSDLVQRILPDLVTMENVPRLAEYDVFQKFTAALKKSGYHVEYRVVNCADYGVPQQRQRLVLLASKLGPISLLKPPSGQSEKRTVRTAIGLMSVLLAGGTSETDSLHQCSALSPLNLKRIKASSPGGTWRDWEKKLVADCHRKKTGKTYPGVYGRMCWDEPAPTITTQFFGFGNGRFGHPEQDRAISLREGAILQSFPNDYEFVEPQKKISKKGVGRLIGNAVPVALAEVIGKSILAHIAQAGKSTGDSLDGGN